MPLFAPLTDTLRWGDLVRQGRAQLPVVAPGWTDQNTSDPGIAALETLAWLVEADSYRTGAVTDPERRLLLALAGFVPRAPRPARALVHVTSGAPLVPRGLVLTGERDGEPVPLSLVDDVAVTGATVGALAWATGDTDADGFRTGCTDLTRERTSGRAFRPLGPDPRPGDAVLVGLVAPAGLPAGTLDLWLVAAEGRTAPERASTGDHHSARTVWEAWDGTAWATVPPDGTRDDTAALTRSGRVRLVLPAVPSTTLGDQAAGALAGRTCAWLRCRLVAGRHDAAPSLAGVHVDVGEVVAARTYSTTLVVPPGATVTGAPAAGGRLGTAVLSVGLAADGTVVRVAFAPPPDRAPDPDVPAVDVADWTAPAPAGATPGRIVADAAVLGPATGVPGETLLLPRPWCGAPPRLWAVPPAGDPFAVRVVPDLVLAGPRDLAASLDPDGVTVRFGDGRWGATLPRGATVLAAGRWTTGAGLADVRPPLRIAVPVDERTSALLGAAAATTRVELVDGLRPGRRAEDVPATAARADAALWVHDRIADAARRHEAASLDELPLDEVRLLDVPERVVTALDLERRALATPGTTIWRARALVDVDPRLPGLVADGCVTVALVPSLPVDRPEPTEGLLARVRAELAATRTLGTRVFVEGPRYVRVGVRATLRLLPGARGEDVVAAGGEALRTFLHPVTGGPAGRGWPFGRAVRRSEVLQVLDALAGVDRVEGLSVVRERDTGEPGTTCGDVAICATELALLGTLELTAAPPDGTRR